MKLKYPKADFTSPFIKEIYLKLFSGYDNIYKTYLENMTTQLQIFIPCESEIQIKEDADQTKTYSDGEYCPIIEESIYNRFIENLRENTKYQETNKEIYTYNCEERLYEFIGDHDFEISLGGWKSFSKKINENQTEFKISIFDNHSFESLNSRNYITQKGNKTKLEKVTMFENKSLKTLVRMVDTTKYTKTDDSSRTLEIFIEIVDKKEFAHLILNGADGVYKRLNMILKEYGTLFKKLVQIGSELKSKNGTKKNKQGNN